MSANEQAFGYGAGYADATKKAQAKIDALVEALRLASNEIHNPGAAQSRGIDIVEVIRAALKAATEGT